MQIATCPFQKIISFLVLIELLSYSFRVVSLALRLFANMMSGHCLLKILAGKNLVYEGVKILGKHSFHDTSLNYKRAYIPNIYFF